MIVTLAADGGARVEVAAAGAVRGRALGPLAALRRHLLGRDEGAGWAARPPHSIRARPSVEPGGIPTTERGATDEARRGPEPSRA